MPFATDGSRTKCMEMHPYSPAIPTLSFFTPIIKSSFHYCGESDEVELAACFVVASKDKNCTEIISVQSLGSVVILTSVAVQECEVERYKIVQLEKISGRADEPRCFAHGVTSKIGQF